MKPDSRNDKTKAEPRKPLDTAEGDRQIVEESLRIHEKKGDLKPSPGERKSAA
jgi:hypothetical protein